MTKTFVRQELNSLHDPSLDLDLTTFSEFDIDCTCVMRLIPLYLHFPFHSHV